MVYIESWDDFAERALLLFRADPVATRYVMKYRHCDGKLVLKVTDNRVSWQTLLLFPVMLGPLSSITSQAPQIKSLSCWMCKKMCLGVEGSCLKFKTDQAQDAKKMEKLNNIFFTLMSRGPDAELLEEVPLPQVTQQPAKKSRGRRQ